MEALIRPDFGLSFWTIVCFVLLLVILRKTAWTPLINAINEREEGLRIARESTDQARIEAERVRDELNSRLAGLKSEIKEQLEDARKTAAREKEAMRADARKSAAGIIASAKKEIEAERAEALRDMKKRVAEISLMAAGQVLRKNMNSKANEELAGQFLAEIEKDRPDLKAEAGNN